MLKDTNTIIFIVFILLFIIALIIFTIYIVRSYKIITKEISNNENLKKEVENLKENNINILIEKNKNNSETLPESLNIYLIELEEKNKKILKEFNNVFNKELDNYKEIFSSFDFSNTKELNNLNLDELNKKLDLNINMLNSNIQKEIYNLSLEFQNYICNTRDNCKNDICNINDYLEKEINNNNFLLQKEIDYLQKEINYLKEKFNEDIQQLVIKSSTNTESLIEITNTYNNQKDLFSFVNLSSSNSNNLNKTITTQENKTIYQDDSGLLLKCNVNSKINGEHINDNYYIPMFRVK